MGQNVAEHWLTRKPRRRSFDAIRVTGTSRPILTIRLPRLVASLETVGYAHPAFRGESSPVSGVV